MVNGIVKCDTQTPSCSNCLRRRETCEYQTWLQVSIAPSSSQLAIASTSTSAQTLSPWTRISNVLLTHIFVPPTQLFPSHPHESNLWRQILHSSLPSHPYLQPIISSIGHLYTPASPTSHLTAYRDQVTASSIFRVSHISIDARNWAAVLIFAVSLLIFQFASQQAAHGEYEYVETLKVLRMSAGIAGACGAYLKRSRVWGLIRARYEGVVGENYDTDTWRRAVDELQTVIDDADGRERDVLSAVVQALKDWAAECNGCPMTWKDYTVFPGAVPSEYLELLASEDDYALLVFIYWCAIMRLGPRRWFFETWLRRSAAMAEAKLSDDWSRLLEWPKSVLDR